MLLFGVLLKASQVLAIESHRSHGKKELQRLHFPDTEPGSGNRVKLWISFNYPEEDQLGGCTSL